MHLSEDIDTLVEVVCGEHSEWVGNHVGPEVEHLGLLFFAEVLKVHVKGEIDRPEVTCELLPVQPHVLRLHWELFIKLGSELYDCLLSCHSKPLLLIISDLIYAILSLFLHLRYVQ